MRGIPHPIWGVHPEVSISPSGYPHELCVPLYPTIRGIIGYWGGAEGYPLGVITSPEGLQMGVHLEGPDVKDDTFDTSELKLSDGVFGVSPFLDAPKGVQNETPNGVP